MSDHIERACPKCGSLLCPSEHCLRPSRRLTFVPATEEPAPAAGPTGQTKHEGLRAVVQNLREGESIELTLRDGKIRAMVEYLPRGTRMVLHASRYALACDVPDDASLADLVSQALRHVRGR